MSMRQVILSEIQTVGVEQGKALAPLTDDLPLLESGLDSLCFAILVSRLEDLTGLDPFADAQGFPRTVGDLVQFFEQAQAHERADA